MEPDLLIMNLPAIIMLGIAASYTDIRQGKIRNMHCAAGIVYGLLSLGAASLIFYATGEHISTKYYADFFVNLLIATAISLVIWSTGLLTAGDVKLFIAFSALVPLSAYKYGYVNLFPSSTILVNTFVPLFVFMFFYILAKTGWAAKVQAMKAALEPKKLGALAVATFGLSWVIMKIMENATFIPQDYFTMILLVFLIIVVSESLLRLKFVWLCAALSVLRVVLDFGALSSAETYINFVFLFFSLLVLRFFALELGSKMFTREIMAEELSEGMIIAEIPDPKRKSRVYYDFVSYLQELKLHRDDVMGFSRRLSREDAAVLRKEFSEKKIERLRIHSTIPFAPFMFFGVLLTIGFGGDALGIIGAAIRGLIG